MDIPTLQDLIDRNIGNFEGRLGQTTPIADVAFLRVISVVQGLGMTGVYKFAAERALQAYAMTATGSDLELIGEEYGVTKRAAVAAELSADLPATTGVTIPAGTVFVGDSNGVRYKTPASVVAAAGVADIDLVAMESGAVTNLQAADTLTIEDQVAGATSQATVTAVDTTGADEELEETYRQRVLAAIRATGGGGNAYDYKRWAEEVAGVYRAYPYSGKPYGSASESHPRDRTVYVQADVSIDVDGIPPAAMLDDVRDSITTDPTTGRARQPLGSTDETLYVEAVSRTNFYVRIHSLVVDASVETEAKAAILSACENYFSSIWPFIDGIDADSERNDLITTLVVSSVVQDALDPYGASATAVSFGLFAGDSLSEYRLLPGQIPRLAAISGVTYV